MSVDTIKPSYVNTAAEILSLKVTETPMIVENLLPKKGMSSLSGSSDGGKSFLGLFLSAVICSEQEKVFGLQINRVHGSVIVVCTEDSAEDICVRLTGFLTNIKTDEQKLRFIFETESLHSKLSKELSRQPADLVIMDTFGDLYNGNINDSISIRNFLKPYKKMANDYKCLFLFNHHIGKGKENNSTPSKNDVLGSQGIESACRTVLMLRKQPDGKRILTVVKGNHTSDEHKNKGLILSFDIERGFETTGDTLNYSDVQLNSKFPKPLIDEILILYPKFKSYQKVAIELKKKGYKKVDKNKVGIIWKEHSPSVQPTTENDGLIEDNVE